MIRLTFLVSTILLSFPVFAYEYLIANASEYDYVIDDYEHTRPAPPSIFVNKADFTLTVNELGETIAEHKVIVGQPGWRTPDLDVTFSQIVINPSWYVPKSLHTKMVKIIKKYKSPLLYINARGFHFLKDQKELDPSTIDWATLEAPYPFDQIIQSPGESNALGRIRFRLENSGSIQMHDTPNKELFEKPVREFSHGCIRVENAIDLASLFLNIPKEEVTEMINSKEKVIFELPRPIQVKVR